MPEVRVEETEHGPALDNGDLRIEVDLNKGTFNVIDLHTQRGVLHNAAIAISLLDAPAFQTRGESVEFAGPADVDDVHGRGVSLTLVRETDEGEPELSFTVTLYDDSRSAVVQAKVHNTSSVRPERRFGSTSTAGSRGHRRSCSTAQERTCQCRRRLYRRALSRGKLAGASSQTE
jgi:hypothetical protein